MTNKTKEQYIKELEDLQKAYNSLKATVEKELSIKKDEDSILRKLILSAEEFIQFTDNALDYNKILQVILDISGAKYAALNVFDENGLDFTTVALAGLNKNIIKGISILGFDVLNKHWNHDPQRIERTKSQIITHYLHLNDLAGDVIPKSVISLIEKTFGVDETFIIKVFKEKKVLGDFTLMFKKGETLINNSLVELYANLTGMFLDRIKITQTLKDSEIKHSTMISNISDVIGIIGTDGRVKYRSPNIEKWFGWQPQDIIGTDGFSNVHPDDMERVKNEFSALLAKDNSSITSEYKYRCKDGSFKDVEMTLKNLTNDPVINGVLLNYRDITDRKKAEQALKESESSLRESQKLAKMGSWTLNISDQTSVWSENCFIIYGYKPFDFEPTLEHVKNRVHPDDWHIVEEGLDYVFKNNVSVSSEIRIILPDGTLKWFQNNVVPIFQDDKLVKINGIIIDITERKISEIALKESEEKIRSIMENSADAIFITNQQGKYVYTNKAVSVLLGYTSEEMKSKTIVDISPRNKIEEYFEFFKKVLREGKGFTEVELLKKDGNFISTDLNSVLLPNGIVYGSCRDITDRKKSEMDLAESVQFNSQIINGAHEGIIVYDRNLKYQVWNPYMENMTGIPSSEVIGKHPLDVFPFLKDAGVIGILEKALIGEKNHGTELPFRIPVTGITGWASDATAPLYNFKNEIIGAITTVRDITERRNAEEDLRVSVSLLNASLESTADGILIVNTENKISQWNQKFIQMWKLSDEILATKDDNFVIGQILSQLTTPEKFTDKVKYLYTHPEESSFDQISFLDGRIYERYSQPQRLGNGIAGRVWSFRDITDRKKAEEALKESEEKYRLLYDSNQMPISIFDAETLNFLSVNNAFVEKYGYTREEFLNMTILDIRPESEIIKLNDTVKIIDEGLVNAGVYIHKKKNGEIIQVEIIRCDLVFDGKKAKLVFANDVTDKTKMEIALLENEKRLVQLNADKDRFISILGHDLKNPFNNILGFSEVLTEDIRNLNKDEIEDIAKNINISAKNTYKLLEDILMWARSQQGKIPFKPQDMSFNEICKDSTEVLKPSANAKNISINYNVEDRITVVADIDMLKTILRNLVSNAIKFTNNGGAINISAERTQSDLTITVSDNGIGINPDNIAKLFDVGQVLTTKGTADEKGTGLGLLLCKDFVEKHQGKIWVESEVGKGSDFKFILPINSELKEINVVKDVVSAETDSNISNLKILITDDDEASRKFLGFTVKAFAKEILYAQNGFEAVMASKANPDIDLILMDIKMPNMEGFEATRQIRQFNKEVTIIAQTAFTGSGEKEKATEAGCNDFITKPINRTILKEIIKKHCNK